tara:strand:- start:1715 stop:2119 length:405 start_codon:yes stop_codon:yes gene_type:complete
MKKLIYLSLITFSLFSCSREIHRNATIANHGKISIITESIPADVIVDKTKTIQGTSVTKVYFGFIKKGDLNYADVNLPGASSSLEKQAAVYKALDGTDFDIIVNPKYFVEIKKSLFKKSTTATVVGYGANVKLK